MANTNTQSGEDAASRLVALQNAIQGVDTSDENRMQGKSYELTWNRALGFGTHPQTHHVFLPYGTWKNFDDVKKGEVKEVPSLLEAAFRDALDVELVKPLPTKGNFFIDIACLGELSPEFLTEKSTNPDGKLGESVAEAIANLVNSFKHNSDVTPIVRILVGKDALNPVTKADEDVNKAYAKCFRNGDGTPLVCNTKALLYLGHYAPNFQKADGNHEQQAKEMAKAVKVLGQWVRDRLDYLVDKVKGAEEAFAAINVEEIAQHLMKHGLSAISWNHAKIIAVNGTTMMTGGGNFWRQYTNNRHDIVDMQAKVLGDAAISAHKYCNYFWDYLSALEGLKKDENENIKPDDRIDGGSFMAMTNFAFDRPHWPAPDSAVPLFPDPWPHGDPSKGGQGKIPVLTAAKLGDWTGSMTTKVRFPVQFIDALRDILLNVIWMAVTSSKEDVGNKATFWNTVVGGLSNYNMKHPSHGLQMPEYGIKISPAAWASRIARCHAIEEAQTSVHICSELFGTFLMDTKGTDNAPAKKAFKELVEKINAKLTPATGGAEWNGRLWPFDLLTAFSTFLCRLYNNRERLNDKNGIWIVITSSKPWDHPDWEDKSRVGELVARVKALFTLQNFLVDPAKQPELDAFVDERLHVARILNDKGPHLCHAKNICVDRNLMYIGSDNTYPTYNEEHGVWVQDETAIDQWYEGFWEGLWERSNERLDAEQMKPDGA